MPASIVVDSTQNIYVVGIYSKDMTLGKIKKKSQGGFDSFLAQFKSDGSLGWIVLLTGQKDAMFYTMTLDEKEHLLVAGVFKDQVTLNGKVYGKKNTNLSFVARFDKNNGSLQWITLIEPLVYSSHEQMFPWQIKHYKSTVAILLMVKRVTKIKIGNITKTVPPLSDKTATHSIIIQFDSTGKMTSFYLPPHSGLIGFLDFQFDSKGNIYAGGGFMKKITINKKIYIPTGKTNAILMKITSNQKIDWVKVIDSPKPNMIMGLEVDRKANVYFYGPAYGSLSLDSLKLTTSHQMNIFLFKLDTQGKLLWGNLYSSNGNINVAQLKVDTLEKIYLAGAVVKNLYYGNQVIKNSLPDWVGTLLLLDKNGKMNSFIQVGQKNMQGLFYRIALDNQDNLYIYGFLSPYKPPATLKLLGQTYQLTGKTNVILWKIPHP